jgi:hypothetical protein
MTREAMMMLAPFSANTLVGSGFTAPAHDSNKEVVTWQRRPESRPQSGVGRPRQR